MIETGGRGATKYSERTEGFLVYRGNYIFHSTPFTPHLSSFSFSFHFVRIYSAGVFYLKNYLVGVNVFHDEVRTIATHVLLYVNPGNSNSMPFHPLDDRRMSEQSFFPFTGLISSKVG